MSDPFHVPTHMLPVDHETDAAEHFLLRESFPPREYRTYASGQHKYRSSYLLSHTYLRVSLQFGDEFPDLVDRHQVEQDPPGGFCRS